jgi:hypothetical protein
LLLTDEPSYHDPVENTKKYLDVYLLLLLLVLLLLLRCCT